MARSLSPALRQRVRTRASGKCEYCLVHQNVSIFTHEVDHIIAARHGGQAVLANLACACLPCHRNKGTDLTAIDPLTRTVVALFNPRQQIWTAHFMLDAARIIGLTPTGRATVALLKINAPTRLGHRQTLLLQGRYP
jgi:hypothetical protein